jgi:hypothetical protein
VKRRSTPSGCALSANLLDQGRELTPDERTWVEQTLAEAERYESQRALLGNDEIGRLLGAATDVTGPAPSGGAPGDTFVASPGYDEPVRKVATFLPVSDELLSDAPSIQA